MSDSGTTVDRTGILKLIASLRDLLSQPIQEVATECADGAEVERLLAYVIFPPIALSGGR